ncbi:MAG: hypothetical protein RLN62_01970 [Rickettsiales bacterium]
MVKEYSKIKLDLGQFSDVDLTGIGGIGAISGAAMMCSGFRVLEDIYTNVSRISESERSFIVIESLNRNRDKHFDNLYKAYSCFKLSEMHKLGELDFVMPPKDSKEFEIMLNEDAEKGEFIFGALASVFENLEKRDYIAIKSELNKVKEQILKQVKDHAERVDLGFVKMNINGTKQTVSEYMEQEDPDIMDFLNKLKMEEGLSRDALRSIVLAVSRDYYENINSEISSAIQPSVHSDLICVEDGGRRNLVLNFDKKTNNLTIECSASYRAILGDEWKEMGSSRMTIKVPYGRREEVKIRDIDELFEGKMGLSPKGIASSLEIDTGSHSFVSVGEGVELMPGSEEVKTIGRFENVVSAVNAVTGLHETNDIPTMLELVMKSRGIVDPKGEEVTSDDLGSLLNEIYGEEEHSNKIKTDASRLVKARLNTVTLGAESLIMRFNDVVQVAHEMTGFSIGGRGSAVHGIAGDLKREMRAVHGRHVRVEEMDVTTKDITNLINSLYLEQGFDPKEKAKEIDDFISVLEQNIRLRKTEGPEVRLMEGRSSLIPRSTVTEVGKKLYKYFGGDTSPREVVEGESVSPSVTPDSTEAKERTK